MFHAPTKSFLYSAYRLTIGHENAAGHTKAIHGTAFYLRCEKDLFLITNRHNLDLVMKDEKYAGYRPTSLQISGYFAGEHMIAELSHQEITIGVPENLHEDVAAIAITHAPFMVNKLKEMSATYIDFSLLADVSQLSKLDVCDMVALPGYPDFYDRNGDRPIVRVGTIASDPTSDYCDAEMSPARRIAYEAFSSAGSSDSPVFALAKGFKAGIGLSGGYFRDISLIGINAGHLTGRDDMNSYHSGISYCFKSTCIIDAMNDALG